MKSLELVFLVMWSLVKLKFLLILCLPIREDPLFSLILLRCIELLLQRRANKYLLHLLYFLWKQNLFLELTQDCDPYHGFMVWCSLCKVKLRFVRLCKHNSADYRKNSERLTVVSVVASPGFQWSCHAGPAWRCLQGSAANHTLRGHGRLSPAQAPGDPGLLRLTAPQQ